MPQRKSKPSSKSTHGTEFGWRVHGLIQDWIRNVDQKASIILAITVAMSGYAAAQVFTTSGSLHAVTDCSRQWWIRIMAGALLLAGAAALTAVFPNLKRRRARRLAKTGLIYFGHLREQSRAEIRKALADMDEETVLDQLSLQLEQTSRIAWKKHALLQLAEANLVVAVVAFLFAELSN
jgi:hypothetical protein